MKWFNWFKQKTTAISASAVPKPVAPLSAEMLQIGIDILRKGSWDLRRMAGDSWGEIPKVHCPIPFGGWGYVEGRTTGMRINKRLAVCQGDNDYDLSELCVLVDNMPVLLLEERHNTLTVFVIAGQDYFQELFSPTTVPCKTVEDFSKLAEPIQKILNDVFAHVIEIKKRRVGGLDPDAIEKILTY